MRALVQRVSSSSVSVDGRVVGATGPGVMVLLGVAPTDTPDDARRLAEKTARLRIFRDAEGRMNRSLLDRDRGTDPPVDGPDGAQRADALVISQFTLYADTRSGHRPGFSGAADGATAEPLYEAYCAALAASGVTVACGVFGADMRVSLVNEGPVTILLEWPPPKG